MGQTIKATFVCDNCEATVVTDGDRPEGWSGRIPRPTDSFIFATGTLGGSYFDEPTYCGDCIRAANEAIDEALRRRKAFTGFNR